MELNWQFGILLFPVVRREGPKSGLKEKSKPKAIENHTYLLWPPNNVVQVYKMIRNRKYSNLTSKPPYFIVINVRANVLFLIWRRNSRNEMKLYFKKLEKTENIQNVWIDFCTFYRFVFEWRHYNRNLYAVLWIERLNCVTNYDKIFIW